VRHIFAYSIYLEITEGTSFATWNVYELDPLALSKSHVF